MGASPGFIMACRAAGLELGELDLRIRVVGSAGAPLPPEGYGWIGEQLGPNVQLNVGSGGTDVCSGLVQNDPMLPVRAGMISGRALGVDAHAFDEDGNEVIGVPGELVITSPMPSMPVGLWGDQDGSRLRDTYFDRYPGIWRHGDWIVFEPDGSCVVTGRSDATLNRGGVRLGTAEFYRVVEELPEISDSLVVHLEDPAGGNGRLMLFVVLATPHVLDEPLTARIRAALRHDLSPRHVPDQIVAVPIVPRNLTGKKLELPVKRILQGTPAASVASLDALADPAALEPFVELARAETTSSDRPRPARLRPVAGDGMRSAPATIAVVGAGSIGGSWVALALAHGLRVHAADPDPAAESRLRSAVTSHLEELAPGTGLAALDRLSVHTDPAEAAAAGDLVIEAGPERLELKRALFATLDEAAAPDVVLASSSSGFGPSAFQDACRHPERVVVAHPFNPPHLVPLVEVVAGRHTSEETVEATMSAMIALGRRPVRVRAELPGHVVNRLQAALWREAYDLIRRGAISVADLDRAVANGPGLRWALLGPIATQHLSGGPGGLQHVLEHLGPPMVDWWADLGNPELTPELAQQLVAGVENEFGGREQELLARRDRALQELLAVKARAVSTPPTGTPVSAMTDDD